jgi:protein-tyrosine phosphatase
VSRDDVIADFALTEQATDRLVADWHARWGGTLWPGYGRAPAEVMTLFLADLDAEYGSVAGYVRAIGVPDEVVTALRDRLLSAG